MNSEGVVLEYSSEPFYKSDEIIAGINAHYGTSFYQEDDIDKDFTIGDTVPNWSAYEKIFGKFIIKIASKFRNDTIVFVGWLYNEIYHYYAIAEDVAYGVSASDGKIVTTIEVKDSIPQQLMEHMNSAGYNVSNIEPDVKQFGFNTIVPNWNDYLVI